MEQYTADWHTEQYWSRISGDAKALQVQQLLGMVMLSAVGVECVESIVMQNRSRGEKRILVFYASSVFVF
jgi:hypothetical protein